MSEAYRVSYLDNPGRGFTAKIIFRWKRGDITTAMSASSGPKDYIRNHICAIFDRHPSISRVFMVCGEYAQSVPFLLLVDDTAGQVVDMAGKAVVVKKQSKGETDVREASV